METRQARGLVNLIAGIMLPMDPEARGTLREGREPRTKGNAQAATVG